MRVMDEPTLPCSPALLADRLRQLRHERHERHAARRRDNPVRRQSLSAKDRATVLAKTAGRCHLCGGEVFERWTADHVLAHAGGGHHAVDEEDGRALPRRRHSSTWLRSPANPYLPSYTDPVITSSSRKESHGSCRIDR